MAQNTSHAVMSQRVESRDSLDDFPTPPWATRALLEHVLSSDDYSGYSALEPACGAGYMAEVLKEYFETTEASDVHAYGYGQVRDFIKSPHATNSVDWIITNPPFKLAEEFVTKGLRVARRGVAVLVRTVFIESIGRYERLFRETPCDVFAQFTERVPIIRGRVDRSATTATGYAWLVWRKPRGPHPAVFWIPPSRRALERSDDYILPLSRTSSKFGSEATLDRQSSARGANLDLFD